MKLNKTIRMGLALMLVLAMAVSAAGCGNSEPEVKPYDYNLEEYVSVGEYKGLEYTSFEVEVTDEEVEEAIEEVLADYTTQTEINEGTVKAGDYAGIKYTMEVEGELIQGTDLQKYVVKVGDSGLMEDVDKAMIGAEVGETVTVETVFAADYDINPEYAGKSVKYEIEILYIAVPEFQELTDEFAKDTLGAKDAEDYREQIRQTLYDSKTSDARYMAGEEIWAKVLEASEVIQYPETELAEKEAKLIEDFTALCEQNEMTLEEALAEVLKIDEEGFRAEMHKSAEAAVKEEMILYSVARENDLELSEKEIQKYMDLLLEASGVTDEQFTQMYGMGIREYAEKGGIVISLLYDAVFNFLVDNGTAK